ncbi:MAG TPA: hypothetical protein VII82_07745 [Polyangiaceae bacterium]|jgi:hypothetical protein
MNGLSPQAQSIVDAARADDGPTDADYARNRRATMARVGLGLGAIGAGASTAATAGAATASATGGVASAVASGSSAATVLALKAIATLAVIGAAGLGTARLHATASERSVVTSVSASVWKPPSQAMAPPVPAERAAAPQSAVESQKPGAPVVDDHRDAPPRTHAAKPSNSVVEGSFSTLAAETALLGATNEALADAKPERALALLDEYAARFPHGTLEEEHAATRAIALCEANRAVEGKDAAALFFRAHPKSPLTARVRFACEE